MIGQAERLIELNKLKTQQKKTDHNKGKIVAFSSGKGGTGKTFVSLNSAFALASTGKKILLIDLDSNLSNINIMMNQKADKTIIDFYLNKSPLKNLITKCYTNLHLIFGDSGRIDYPQDIARYSEYLMNEIRALAESYDYVFLDISSGAGEDVILILKSVDWNVIITNPEPTAVMDAYVIIKMLHTSGVLTEKLVIINKCYKEDDGKSSFDNLNKAAVHFLSAKLKLLGIIEFDQSVNKAIVNQEIYIKTNQHTRTSNLIRKAAANLVKFTQVANNNHTKIALY